jgi:hypothetical protein
VVISVSVSVGVSRSTLVSGVASTMVSVGSGAIGSGAATERVLRWLRLVIGVSDEDVRDCAPALGRRVLDGRDAALRDVVTICWTTSVLYRFLLD